MLPHAKTRKYDRQLRLWDSSGQEALESAHLCLLGSSAVASETAKNLVLPGLGELTIVDDELVKQSDIECNFFVPSDSEGLQRAAHVRTLLQDLNCDLKCTLDCRSASKVIFEENEDYWFSFTVVIACGVDTQSLLKLGNILYERNIPLIVEDVASFYGYMRISIKEHTIMETHPESLVDLRLDATWPALDDFTASYDLQTLTQSEREHVPYVVLLLIYLRKWRKLSGKSHPESSLERAELKKLINNGRICGDDQENYDEAVATIWRLAKRSEVPSYIIDMISSPSAQVTRQSSPFWILVAGLGKYLETHSLLPLSGVIPDMKADTKQYVSLQQIYRLKSQQDFEDFKRSYLWVLEKVGLPDNYISQDIAQLFCKHSAYLKVIYGTQLEYTRHLEMNCKFQQEY